MGGLGSGRRDGRPLVENCLKLDIVSLVRHGRTNEWRLLSWLDGLDEPFAHAWYWLDLARSELILSYVTVPAGRSVKLRIRLDETHPHFGGRRWWVLCPGTNRRCRMLYHGPGSDYFLGRNALCLAYESQREDPAFRSLRRAQKILVGLGGDGDLDEIHYLPKPKWMRWRTFDARMTKAQEASADSWSQALSRFGSLSVD